MSQLPISLLQSARLDEALEHVNAPSYVGNVEGCQFTSVVAPEETRRLHIRHVLRAFGAQSRLDAVAIAHGAR